MMNRMNAPANRSPDAHNNAPPLPAAGDGPHGPSMEVAHVLFMDIIGYSKLRMNQQAAAQIELQNLVNASAEVQQAKAERKFVCRPTGDGMALLFFRDLVSPVRTALQIHALMDQRAVALRATLGTDIKMRMGIHSGTILMVEDLNAQSDAAGDGINIAQRVMDCGDADHILLSDKVAGSLLHADPWQHYLSDLGECRVKHGVKIHLYRLRGRLDGPYYGAAGIPAKVKADQDAMGKEIAKYRGTFFEQHPQAKKQALGFLVFFALVGTPVYLWQKNPGFKKSLQTAYAKATNFSLRASTAAKPTKTTKNGGGGHTSRSSSGGGRSSGGGNGGGGEVFASGSHKAVVPDLIGRTFDDALTTAHGEGLSVSKSEKSSYSTAQGEGLVYEQSPAAGASVKEGTRVWVRISKGDPPDAAAAAAAAATEKDPDDE